jgi:hypothetical protein
MSLCGPHDSTLQVRCLDALHDALNAVEEADAAEGCVLPADVVPRLCSAVSLPSEEVCSWCTFNRPWGAVRVGTRCIGVCAHQVQAEALVCLGKLSSMFAPALMDRLDELAAATDVVLASGSDAMALKVLDLWIELLEVTRPPVFAQASLSPGPMRSQLHSS